MRSCRAGAFAAVVLGAGAAARAVVVLDELDPQPAAGNATASTPNAVATSLRPPMRSLIATIPFTLAARRALEPLEVDRYAKDARQYGFLPVSHLRS